MHSRTRNGSTYVGYHTLAAREAVRVIGQRLCCRTSPTRSTAWSANPAVAPTALLASRPVPAPQAGPRAECIRFRTRRAGSAAGNRCRPPRARHAWPR
jgi:hypothetical protein